jgi:hypothetical protein
MTKSSGVYRELKALIGEQARRSSVETEIMASAVTAAGNAKRILAEVHAQNDPLLFLEVLGYVLGIGVLDPIVVLGHPSVYKVLLEYACNHSGDASVGAIMFLCSRLYRPPGGLPDVDRMLHLAWDISCARNKRLARPELNILRRHISEVAAKDVGAVVRSFEHFYQPGRAAASGAGYRTLNALKNAVRIKGYEKVIGDGLRQKVYDFLLVHEDARHPILILGETSTGKEWVTEHVIHENTQRKGKLVPANCASLTQSELEKKLKEAAGGTLLLDEAAGLVGKRGLKVDLHRPMRDNKDNVLFVVATTVTRTDVPDQLGPKMLDQDLWSRLTEKGYLTIPPFRDRRGDAKEHLIELARDQYMALSDDLLERIAYSPKCAFDNNRGDLTRIVTTLTKAAREHYNTGTLDLAKARELAKAGRIDDCEWLRDALLG